MTVRSKDKPRVQPGTPAIKPREYLGKVGREDKTLCHVRLEGGTQDATLPWPTVILGSGCQDKEGVRNRLSALSQILVEAIYSNDPMASGACGRSLAEEARLFTESLLAERLGTHAPVVQAEPGVELLVEATKIAALAKLLTAATLVTPMYYSGRAKQCRIPPRPNHDDEVVEEGGDLAKRLRKVLESVNKEAETIAGCLSLENPAAAFQAAEGAGTLGSLRRLIESTVCGMMPDGESVVMRLSDLRWLTEVLWLGLAATALDDGTTSWGWSDLLADLSFSSGRKSPVPLFGDIAAGARLISARFTKRFLDTAATSTLHYAVAELLVAQQQTRKNSAYEAGWPPAPSVFVTTFDLSLELALLKQNAEFTVVLPVHVVSPTHGVAHACWLSFEVQGGDSHQSARHRFEAAQASLRLFRSVDKAKGPVIVHLVGCPLVPLPELRDLPNLQNDLTSDDDGFLSTALREEAWWGASTYRTQEKNLEDLKKELILQHAIVIGEHDAVLQNALDLIHEPQVRDGGLPSGIAAGRPGWFRYWMLLGVQLGDSAVRHRVATVISSLPRAAVDFGQGATQCGVAVSTRPGDLEASLLSWNGIEVVEGDAFEFEDQMRHFANHFAETDARVAFPVGQAPCRLLPQNGGGERAQ